MHIYGAGNQREFDFVRLCLGRDLDVHSNPLGGKFDSVAILEVSCNEVLYRICDPQGWEFDSQWRPRGREIDI